MVTVDTAPGNTLPGLGAVTRPTLGGGELEPEPLLPGPVLGELGTPTTQLASDTAATAWTARLIARSLQQLTCRARLHNLPPRRAQLAMDRPWRSVGRKPLDGADGCLQRGSSRGAVTGRESGSS
jgi:hypothetical protein